MITQNEMSKLAEKYDKPCVAVLGSHSALDVSQGARKEGLKSVVVCQKGRERTYEKYYKTKKTGSRELGCIDEIMLLSKFKEIAENKAVDELVKKQALFVPHRSFSVYVGYDLIENEFRVPIFGNRALLRAEERNVPKNQHWLLQKAGIRVPKTFPRPSEIDRLVIVKAPEAARSYERAFFLVNSEKEYHEKSSEMLKKGIISEEGLKSALIEEFVLGAQYNFNFFFSPINNSLELLGTDMRRQTNLDGFLRLPAAEQLEVAKKVRVNNIEVGHVACTIRESLLERVFEAGEKFVQACRKEYSPGLIGPFALQGALVPAEKGEEIVIFDVSFRVPGSPGVRFTPYTEYLYGESVSTGRRIAMEIKEARKQKRMGEIVT